MAVLTTQQLAELRKAFGREDDTADWTKPQIDAAFQAVEDEWEGVQASIGAAIDTATSPLVIPNPVKKRIGKAWLFQRFQRGG